ncbi:hypothetical protein JAAARDRAFT_207055 [Jaapia argillacea MUCL 33604]|uniref:Uncharacterized protein n=1 Tax=Jaapia argillacea MUCL 33604 TaxID=933084 RepID=A0A067PRS9_9AGAM|nr:hypothetical protein JAAARDRAFT_207055 [Jaapia argillacea MUCL 33604]
MAFNIRHATHNILNQNHFCYCLPVRLGVIIMSILGLLLAGTMSITIWYEDATNHDISTSTRGAFILAGLVESFLCVSSIIGLVGAIVRQQIFVAIYTYILYGHCVINIMIASFFLWMVNHASPADLTRACDQFSQDPNAPDASVPDPCPSLIKVAPGIYAGVAAFVLLVELYGALVATWYLNQLKREKRISRTSRGIINRNSDVPLLSNPRQSRYASLSSIDGAYLPQPFTPPEQFSHQFVSEPQAIPIIPSSSRHVDDGVEEGYGGGTWTHEHLIQDEKERLKAVERLNEGAGTTGGDSPASEGIYSPSTPVNLMSPGAIIAAPSTRGLDTPPAYEPMRGKGVHTAWDRRVPFT